MAKARVTFKMKRIAGDDWQIIAERPGEEPVVITSLKTKAEVDEWLSGSRKIDWLRSQGYAKCPEQTSHRGVKRRSTDRDLANPFELRDRLVGETKTIAIARVEHLVDDLQQPVVDQCGVLHRAGSLQVIRRDVVGLAHDLDIRDL